MILSNLSIASTAHKTLGAQNFLLNSNGLIIAGLEEHLTESKEQKVELQTEPGEAYISDQCPYIHSI